MPPAAAAAGTGAAAGGASTATTVATYAALAAAGVSAYSSYQQGQYQESMGKYNAAVAAQEAQAIEQAKMFEERDLREEGRRLRARQLLQFAKGGVVPSSGTPLIVGEQTAVDIEKDIAKMRYGYGLQRSRALGRSALAKKEGRALKRASRWSAGSSLLTGAYRASSVYA